jgi:hypothetical protein
VEDTVTKVSPQVATENQQSTCDFVHSFQNNYSARHVGSPVVPATWEAEMGRTRV